MNIQQAILLDLALPIQSKRLVIRPFMAGDGPALFEAILESVEALKVWNPWARCPMTLEGTEETVRRFHADFILRQALHFGIFRRHRLVGACGLARFNWEIPSCSLGYWLRTSEYRNGYATEAANALTRYAFEQLKIRRLTIECDDENVRSAALAERLLFELEVKGKGLAPAKENSNELRIGRVYVRFDTKTLPKLSCSW